jgi:hypothetical protein
MGKKHHQFHWHFRKRSTGVAPAARIVAMTLADELAQAVAADAEQRRALVDAALCVGQWLADQGLPGRWDRVRPAQVLRCLDFLSPAERERFLLSLVGLLGHAGLRGQIPPAAAKRAIDEAAALTEVETTRFCAQATAAQLAVGSDLGRAASHLT